MTEKKKPHLIKTFQGQLLVFLLLWSSCQTMSYYLVTENYRKAKKISNHYVESKAMVVGIDLESFTFPDGETLYVEYDSEEKRTPALFLYYKTIDNFDDNSTTINTYLKTFNLSFNIDSIKIGSSFRIVYSGINDQLFMEEGQYVSSLSDEHIKKIHWGLKSFGIVWLIILAVLWLIMWIIYKVNNEEMLMTPEKDVRSLKVKFGLALEPNDWDEDL